MRTTERLSITIKIKEIISNAPLIEVQQKSSPYIFHDTQHLADLIVRQYLMIRVVGVGFNKSILAAVGGALPIHILPPHAIKILRDHGIPAYRRLSLLAWYIYVFTIWGYGVLHFGKTVFQTWPKYQSHNIPMPTSAFFSRLTPGNIPSSNRQKQCFYLLNWYASWAERSQEINTIVHDTNNQNATSVGDLAIKSQPTEIPRFRTWTQWIRFICWGNIAGVRSLSELIIGQWWHALMFAEATKSRHASLHEIGSLPKEYWFNHTGYIYRPMWTYTAEKKGSNIYLYFYSVNNSAILKAGSHSISIGIWHLMNWPNYVVWGEPQKLFVRRSIGDQAKIYAVDDIPFTDCELEIPNISGKKIAVFDVQPYRPFFHSLQAQVFEYYNDKLCTDFLTDIYHIAKLNSAVMVWKQKRETHNRTHRKYIRISEQLTQDKTNLATMDPRISAHRIIANSDVVISMPYTSTALIGRNLGKPSCYYDPSGIIDPSDEAAQGIKILTSKAALHTWICSNLPNDCADKIELGRRDAK